MKARLLPIGLMMLLSSCVFESRFEATAKVPVNPALPGCWEEIQSDGKSAVGRVLVLQHSPNDYLVSYPEGEKAMYFQPSSVDLGRQRCTQIWLIGTADGPVKPEDRKYHLLKAVLTDGELEIRTIKPEMLGKDLGDTASLRAAFINHKDEESLFGEPARFRRKVTP